MSWPPESGDTAPWIVNGKARLETLAAAGKRWTVTLGDADQGRQATWLTSLVSALIGTPKDEAISTGDAAGRFLRLVLGLVERLALFAGADKAAIVNNALLSVSPIGPSGLHGLAGALREAAARWPKRVVAARGIVAHRDAVKACAALAGGTSFPSRVSYAFDLTERKLPDKINAERDQALLRKAKLERIVHDDFTLADLDAAHAQYTAVYIGRHGSRNPQLTPVFFADVHRTRGAEFFGLKSNGVLQAFVALRDHGDFLSVPLIGYRTDVDKKAGLYRQIFALALEIGRERKAIVNFGAGAGHYKKLRGANLAIEYTIIIPTRATMVGRALHAMLKASEEPLERLVPKAISRFGG